MCRTLWFAAVALFAIFLQGCGGGGNSSAVRGAVTPVRFSIAWGQRSRTVMAPSSALSAALTLANAAAPSGDFTFTVNRDANPAAYTGSYTTTTSAKAGTWPMTIRFYAMSDGGGDVVGIAQASVTIANDGTGIGDIATSNTVDTVVIDAGQTINVGETKDLALTVKDAQGNLVAVSPGSAVFTVLSGAGNLQFTNGQATGVGRGQATVTAALDGKTSPAASVSVVIPPPAG